RYNVLCDKVILEGTIRASSKEARELYHRRIREVCDGIARSYGGRADVEIADGYHIVNNDEEQTRQFIDFAVEFLGKENVDTALNVSLIGEDFSFYTEKLPSTYFFMGCESEYPLHNDKFYPKEETLDVAVKMMLEFFIKSI
ncbi:MAG: amidohydrolase, partial [Oscillospiraceae bacterium]